MSQIMLECPVCLETKEKKDFMSLKCCDNTLCKSCEPNVRIRHGNYLPGHTDHRFIRCPLCRQMEMVPFDLVCELLVTRNMHRNLHWNLQDFSINFTPDHTMSIEQQNQRDRDDLHRFINLQEQRRTQERIMHEELERIGLEDQDIIRQQNQDIIRVEEQERIHREEQERQYGADLLNAIRLINPIRINNRTRPNPRRRREPMIIQGVELVRGNLEQDRWIE
jgi:hypothetical protein